MLMCVFQAKGKLVRSKAVCEEAPPQEDSQVIHAHTDNITFLIIIPLK